MNVALVRNCNVKTQGQRSNLETCSLVGRHVQKSKDHLPGPHPTKEKLLVEADKGSAY